MKRKILLSVVLMLFLILISNTVFADSEELEFQINSGTCVTYKLENDEVTLTGEYPKDVENAQDLGWIINEGERQYQVSKLHIPDTLNGYPITKIEFGFCEWGFHEITLPNTLKVLCSGAFAENNITSIDIPASVEILEDSIFPRCDLLQSINVDPNNKNYCSVDGVVYTKNFDKIIMYPVGKNEAKYTILNSVKTICARTFQDSSLENIIIPNTVTDIEYGAFARCHNLKEITLPISIKNIAQQAFWESISLEKVKTNANPTNLGENIFSKWDYDNSKYILSNENLTLEIAKGSSLEQYAKDNNIKYVTNEISKNDKVIEVPLDILDKDNNCITVMPPESGGINGYIDSSLSYDNCKYELFINMNNYDDTIEVEKLGTFHKGTTSYIADIKDTSILKTGRFQTLQFELVNKNTEKIDKIKVYLLCYKKGFGSNANLSVNGNELIKNGKIINDFIDNGDNKYIIYNEVYNELTISNINIESLNYNNMGETFIISSATLSNGKWTRELLHSTAGVKVKSDELNENDILVIDKIKEGESYNKVKDILGDDYSNLQVYDISMENNQEKVQPNGAIIVYIPIKDGMDLSNLVVFYISDDGTKTEFTVTVKEEDGKKYATFETNHFSKYVLAEKGNTTKQQEENLVTADDNKTQEKTVEQVEDTARVKDNTPKTGNISSYVIIIISIVSVILIVVIIKKYKKRVK